ncbi:MAG: helix-turn-helix domain-containing protein [Nitrospirota bacterium]
MNGTDLKRLRKRLGFTQAQLAKEIGLHPNSVARMERGELTMRPAIDRLLRLLARQKGETR